METESNPESIAANDTSMKCEICGASLGSATELTEHKEAHLEQEAEGILPPPGGPRHKCALCDMTFPTPEDLKTHIQDVHEK